MNTVNNKRRRESVEKIEKTFIELLQDKELEAITVSDICKKTGLNRSTFYSNFMDIYDLADKVKENLENEFAELFKDYKNCNEHNGALRMFTHIKENQLFYKTYFKLCYKSEHLISIYNEERAEKDQIKDDLKYHIEFFRNGLNAIIKMWMAGGCKESPQEMANILKKEYRGR